MAEVVCHECDRPIEGVVLWFRQFVGRETDQDGITQTVSTVSAEETDGAFAICGACAERMKQEHKLA